MFFLLLFAFFFVGIADEIDDRMSFLYYVYPENYIPDINHVLSTPNLDVNAFGPSVYVEDVSHTDREGILERYKFSDEFQGFVFDGDTLKYTIMTNKTGNDFTGDFGKLVKKNNWKYYEKRPKYNSKVIYIDMGLGYTSEYRRKNLKDHCFYNSTTESTKTLCDQIPRCLGFIPGQCLVSFKGLNNEIDYNTDNYDYDYSEKINEHAIFRFIRENLILFGFGTVGVLLVEFAVFNFNFLRPVLKNTWKLSNGSLKYISGRKKRKYDENPQPKVETTYEF
jgi:hypothetical protein